MPAIRSLFPEDWTGEPKKLTPEVSLIPEPDGSRGPWAISVRAQGGTLGYIGEDEAPLWAGVLRRVLASGFVPSTRSRIWGSEDSGWDGPQSSVVGSPFSVRVVGPPFSVQIALGKPNEALPLNDPPAVPYTMLPRSSTVHVTKENEHFDTLRAYVPKCGYGPLFVTLHECVPDGRAKPHVEVRINDERIGQLTPQMSQRFLPMIRYLHERGLLTACWGDITGSPVAAEVRIDAIKANEATPEVLDGPPNTIPLLIPEELNPTDYDLTPMRPLLEPLPLVQRPRPP